MLKSIRTFSAVDVHSDVPKKPTCLLAIRGVFSATAVVCQAVGSYILTPARLGEVSVP